MKSIDIGSDSIPTLEDTVIGLMDNPTIPALWDSRDEGEAWEWGDYIVILQTMPITMAEGMVKWKKEMPDIFKEIAEKCKNEFRYLYAMTLYYKKGKNPSGKDSSRPAKIIALEQTKQFGEWSPIFVGMFTPKCRMNLGTYSGEGHREAVRKFFFSRLLDDKAETPRRFGVIADAFELQTGKPFHKKASKAGCLGIIMFLVLLPVFLVMMTGIIIRFV